MGKTNFRQNGSTFDALVNSGTTSAEPSEEPKTPKYYRINLQLPIMQKDYLQEIAWRHRTSITQYIADLIAEDMEKHPEWTDTVDVLNTSGRK